MNSWLAFRSAEAWRLASFGTVDVSEIADQFLVPAKGDPEIIVLTDADMTASVVLTRNDSQALSRQATEILDRSMFAGKH